MSSTAFLAFPFVDLITLILFVVLQFPLIYAKNIHTVLAMRFVFSPLRLHPSRSLTLLICLLLYVSRFLTGFFGSPALATGGASMGDLYEPKYAAYALGIWGVGAVAGPVLGPMLGGFTFSANGWTWVRSFLPAILLPRKIPR
jgi:DHA1 family multidrug resistance protein-like MFS transporter